MTSSTLVKSRGTGVVGFQETELGNIPNDWVLQRIADVCVIFGRIGFRGYTVADIVGEGEGAISLSPSNIQDSRLNFDRCTYISWTKWKESPEIQISNGDILLVKTGSTVGKTAFVEGLSVEATVNPQVVVLKKSKISSRLLGYVLNHETIQRQLVASTVGGALPTLSQKQIGEFRFPSPQTRHEQDAIAEALSDAEALIGSLEQLIAKKRAIKQAAMQELLSGRRRLLSFDMDWKQVRLSDIAQIRSGGTPSTARSEYWDGDVLWCTPTDITALGERKYLHETSRKITDSGRKSSSAEWIPARSVIMTSRATIGECAINVVPITTNQGFKNLVPNEDIDGEFLYYFMATQKERLIALCGGSTFLEIGKAQLSSFEIEIPATKAEQNAISAILSEMDAELEVLSQRLSKAHWMKQGMMQELLTGRTRLV